MFQQMYFASTAIGEPTKILESIDYHFRKLSQKIPFYGEEMEYLDEFIAEARVTKQEGIANLAAIQGHSYVAITLIALGIAEREWKQRRQRAEQENVDLSSVIQFYEEYHNVLPNALDLSTMLEYEHALVRVYLREMAGSSASASKDEPANLAPLLSVGDWSQLAIGIDEHVRYFAISPAPKFGSAFSKSRSVQLPLRGERWKEVLKLLADAPDGQTISSADVIRALNYLPLSSQVVADSRARPGKISEAHRAELMQLGGTARSRLNSLLSDLRRELRIYIQGPTGREATCLSSRGEKIHAGFRVAYLLADESGHLRFGEARG